MHTILVFVSSSDNNNNKKVNNLGRGKGKLKMNYKKS